MFPRRDDLLDASSDVFDCPKARDGEAHLRSIILIREVERFLPKLAVKVMTSEIRLARS